MTATASTKPTGAQPDGSDGDVREEPGRWRRLRIFLGSVYARSGRVSEALPLLERAAADSIRRPTWAAVRLGEGYLLAGQVGDATAAAERQLQATRDRKELGTRPGPSGSLGDIALRRDSPEIETAEDYYRHAVALAEELGMRPLVAHCHLGLGKLYARTGQARAGAGAPHHRDDDVPRDGHTVLAREG